MKTATEPFVYQPLPAQISTALNCHQRYFRGNDEQEKRATLRHKHSYGSTFHISQLNVMRFARDDVAKVEIETSSNFGRAEIAIDLNPQQLRDFAQRLLDAAHDLEQNPASQLAQQMNKEAA